MAVSQKRQVLPEESRCKVQSSEAQQLAARTQERKDPDLHSLPTAADPISAGREHMALSHFGAPPETFAYGSSILRVLPMYKELSTWDTCLQHTPVGCFSGPSWESQPQGYLSGAHSSAPRTASLPAGNSLPAGPSGETHLPSMSPGALLLQVERNLSRTLHRG